MTLFGIPNWKSIQQYIAKCATCSTQTNNPFNNTSPIALRLLWLGLGFTSMVLGQNPRLALSLDVAGSHWVTVTEAAPEQRLQTVTEQCSEAAAKLGEARPLAPVPEEVKDGGGEPVVHWVEASGCTGWVELGLKA
jgi:hypothetical protein